MNTTRTTTDLKAIGLGLSRTKATAQRIVVQGFICKATIGVSDAERTTPQRISIDAELTLTTNPPVRDEVAETLNYGLVVRRLRDLGGESTFQLLETLADALAVSFFEFENVEHTRIRIVKLDRYEDVGGIGIELERCRKNSE